MPTCFMSPYHPSKHSYENFVDCFDLAVGLWIIGCRVIMVKTQLFSKFGHHKIPKVATVIHDDSLGNTKMSYNVIKKEQWCGLSSVVKCQHLLSPFRKLINEYNDVTMPPG